MINYQAFIEHITDTQLQPWVAPLQKQLNELWRTLNDGNLPRLLTAIEQLPPTEKCPLQISDIVTVTNTRHLPIEPIIATLEQLKPWRKGPFQIADTLIDSEWQCNLKWQRVAAHISDLEGRHVLDVGSGNGYYGWRMKQAGARTVAGIDPSWLSVVQHLAINHFAQDPSHVVLPFTLESLSANLECFDSVFSMGVLYHRRSPLDHLEELRNTLRPGGELVLETIVIPGAENEALVPIGRYARMNNVWFLPSAATLKSWLEKMGFDEVRVVDETKTTADEQRTTHWKPGQSLADYLDPNNPDLTIEGHPAPVRAILIARKPINQRLKRYHL